MIRFALSPSKTTSLGGRGSLLRQQLSAGHTRSNDLSLFSMPQQRSFTVLSTSSSYFADNYLTGITPKKQWKNRDSKQKQQQGQQQNYEPQSFLSSFHGIPAITDEDFHQLQHPRRNRELKNSMTPTAKRMVTTTTTMVKSSSSINGSGTLDIRREYHNTVPSERAVMTVALGLASVSAVAYAGASAVQTYNEWKAAQPPPSEQVVDESDSSTTKAEDQNQKEEAAGKSSGSRKNDGSSTSSQTRENIFKEWFGVGVGSKYYEGGFEDTMTKREAALILGVRESSSAQRIKEAHRKLLVLNHPDTGGSTYMAGKINEAKELLLKGKA